MWNVSSKNVWPKKIMWFVYLIWALLLFTIIYDAFDFSTRALFWVLQLWLAIFIYSNFKMPSLIYFGILSLFLANLFGEVYLELFYVFPYYDKIIHLLSPLVVCTMLYFILEKKVPDKNIRLLLSGALLLSFELIWELLEYYSDLYLNTVLTGVQLTIFENLNNIQVLPAYEDTIYDMLGNLAGTIIFLILGKIIISKKLFNSKTLK